MDSSVYPLRIPADGIDDDTFKQLMSQQNLPVLTPKDALRAVSLRIKHVVDELPHKNVIFEIDSDLSEDSLSRIVEKLSSKFAQIDVMTAEDELVHFVVERLVKELVPTTVDERNGTTEMKGTWREYYKTHDYSLTVGRISHFVRAEFERDVREKTVENRAAVLYRTESMLDGRGIMEPADVDTVDRQVAPMLYQIYLLVDEFDDDEVVRRLREYIKRYTDPFLARFLADRLEDFVRSARAAKTFMQGTNYGLVKREGSPTLIVTSSTAREHLAILQYLQLRHSLPVTPLRIATLTRSPYHLLKAYDRLFGVFRRGGYELLQWLPLLVGFTLSPARVYPHEVLMAPIVAAPASATICEWIVQVEQLMGWHWKIPQRGVRLIVCPSTSAMNQLWRYLKYSHDVIVSQTTIVVCTGTAEQLERAMYGRNGDRLVTVVTTAALFETWHTRYLCNMQQVTVFLGTPRKELPYLHRAYRFARPVTNVITVPLETTPADHTPSGFDSDASNDKGPDGDLQQQQLPFCLPAQALPPTVHENRSHWAAVFIKEMWGRGDWRPNLSCTQDKEYEMCVQWMRRKWREEERKNFGKRIEFDVWRAKMMEEKRDKEETREFSGFS